MFITIYTKQTNPSPLGNLSVKSRVEIPDSALPGLAKLIAAVYPVPDRSTVGALEQLRDLFHNHNVIVNRR